MQAACSPSTRRNATLAPSGDQAGAISLPSAPLVNWRRSKLETSRMNRRKPWSFVRRTLSTNRLPSGEKEG